MASYRDFRDFMLEPDLIFLSIGPSPFGSILLLQKICGRKRSSSQIWSNFKIFTLQQKVLILSIFDMSHQKCQKLCLVTGFRTCRERGGLFGKPRRSRPAISTLKRARHLRTLGPGHWVWSASSCHLNPSSWEC